MHALLQCHSDHDKVNVVEVIKMGNIAHREGIEPTFIAFQAGVLTITPPRLHDVTILPKPTCVCGSLPERSVPITSTPLPPPPMYCKFLNGVLLLKIT